MNIFISKKTNLLSAFLYAVNHFIPDNNSQKNTIQVLAFSDEKHVAPFTLSAAIQEKRGIQLPKYVTKSILSTQLTSSQLNRDTNIKSENKDATEQRKAFIKLLGESTSNASAKVFM